MEQILINKLQNIVKSNQGSVADSISNVLLKNLSTIKHKTIIQVSKEANCSKASVVKFAKRLGLDGYKELIHRLNMEASVLVPQLTLTSNGEMHQTENALLSRYYHLISENLEYIQNNFMGQIVEAVKLVRNSKKVYLFGKGANLNGLNILNNYLIKLNYWTNYASDLDIQKQYVKNVEPNDVCLFFSYSGLTEEMVEFYEIVKNKGAKIILVTSNQLSPMYDQTNVNLFVLKNEEVQQAQRNSLMSIIFIIMEMVYLLSN